MCKRNWYVFILEIVVLKSNRSVMIFENEKTVAECLKEWCRIFVPLRLQWLIIFQCANQKMILSYPKNKTQTPQQNNKCAPVDQKLPVDFLKNNACSVFSFLIITNQLTVTKVKISHLV